MDMMNQCMEMMNNMMGGGSMMGGGLLFAVLAVVLLVWLVGLAVIGGLSFWAYRRLRSQV